MAMPFQNLLDAVRGASPIITSHSDFPISDEQIQPSSIDFRLGSQVYKVRSAGLPDNCTVEDLIKGQMKYRFKMKQGKENLLERGGVYIVELFESCALPPMRFVDFSPKSSTGRMDVYVRVLSDNFPLYDRTAAGYHGRLYAEITPLSFDVRISPGLALTQGRVKKRGAKALNEEEIRKLHIKEGFLFGKDGKPLRQEKLRIEDDGELYFHVDLNRDIIGFVAKDTVDLPLDFTQINKYKPVHFWEPIYRPENGIIILQPGHFYLLVTKERVKIPISVCGQMTNFNQGAGELRPHYAGFFDPGFGGERGTHGVLEVRVQNVPFRLHDGQPICTMKFEWMDELPAVAYTGNYTKPDPSLSKHFENRYEAWEPAYWRSL